MTIQTVLLIFTSLGVIGLLIAQAKLATLYEELNELLVKTLGADIMLSHATWKMAEDISAKVDDMHQVLADGPFVDDEMDEDEQPTLRN